MIRDPEVVGSRPGPNNVNMWMNIGAIIVWLDWIFRPMKTCLQQFFLVWTAILLNMFENSMIANVLAEKGRSDLFICCL